MKNVAAWASLPLPEGEAPVYLVRRARKSIGIRIADGCVELVAHPRVSQQHLRQVLDEKRDWIIQHVLRQREQQRAAADLSAVVYLGQPLALRLTGGLRRTARLAGGALEVSGVTDSDEAGLRLVVERWLKRQALSHFSSRLAALAALCARKPSGLALSSARTRWGSCTAAGVVRLNWRLMQAPPAIIDYVLAHELAHLSHMDHSPAFWRETGRLYPDWKNARHWLKQHGGELFRFG